MTITTTTTTTNEDDFILTNDDQTTKIFLELGLPIIEMNHIEEKGFSDLTDETKQRFFAELVQKTMGQKGQPHMFNGERGDTIVTLSLNQILKVLCATYVKLVGGSNQERDMVMPSKNDIQVATMLNVEELDVYLDAPVVFINMAIAVMEKISATTTIKN